MQITVERKKLVPGRPPVVLLGGLGQVWPLGFAGIPVIVATRDSADPSLASRYVCGRCVLPSSRDEGLTVAALLHLGRYLRDATGAKAPLFCGNDPDLGLTYRFHDRLSQVYALFDNPPATGSALLDKELFYTLARERGLAVPQVYDWDGPNGVAHAPRAVIVKPKSKAAAKGKTQFGSLFGEGKAKVFPDAATLLAHTELAAINELLIIQDYIPGNDNSIHSFHGLADRGNLLAWFLGRKIRTFPKLTGESTFIELIKEPALFELGATIAQRLALTGPFKIDFKRHADTGQYYLLEINARFTLWHHLGAANGINIPKAAYEYLVEGKRPQTNDYGTKYKWNSFLLDYYAYRELRSLGETNLAKWLRSLLAAHRVQNVFSWKDPAPFFVWALGFFSEWMCRWHSTAS